MGTLDMSAILGMVIGIGAIIVVVIQLMYPTIPKYIGWPIVGVLLILSIVFMAPDHIPLGWEIFLIIAILILTFLIFIYFWRIRSRVSPQTANTIAAPFAVFRKQWVHALRTRQAHKAQAHKIHIEIIDLYSLLENKKDELAKNQDWSKQHWQENPEVRGILDKLQIQFNELGYLVNNYEYDRWVEAMMDLNSKELHFHMKGHDSAYDEWGRARINAKLRTFIRKVK